MFSQYGNDEYMALTKMTFFVQDSYLVTEDEYFSSGIGHVS